MDKLTHEVEAFSAERGEVPAEEPSEVFEETEVAEALAVSWKDKRREPARAFAKESTFWCCF